ncbi:MAG: Nitrogen fixation protein VnfA [Cryomorphaceae bacterium]|nr:MAG: Nitrogen fixation protein VnfA [Cryomorphaceae bacterium]
MSAIPLELAESALFGHEVGAFTGAVKTKKGVFEEAADGILFMDEIGETPLEIQAKLLRAVQERVFRRVGGTKDIPFNARIITATHRDFQELVQEGSFREDLFYRLMGFPIKLYPLRNHKSDIVDLTNKFLAEFSANEGEGVKVLSEEAMSKLLSYDWPGNIRELKAVIQLAIILSEDRLIDANCIRLTSNESTKSHGPVLELGEKTLKEYTKTIIEEHMDAYDDDLEKVSAVLQIGKSTLYRMIKNNEIKRSKS